MTEPGPRVPDTSQRAGFAAGDEGRRVGDVSVDGLGIKAIRQVQAGERQSDRVFRTHHEVPGDPGVNREEGRESDLAGNSDIALSGAGATIDTDTDETGPLTVLAAVPANLRGASRAGLAFELTAFVRFLEHLRSGVRN